MVLNGLVSLSLGYKDRDYSGTCANGWEPFNYHLLLLRTVNRKRRNQKIKLSIVLNNFHKTILESKCPSIID